MPWRCNDDDWLYVMQNLKLRKFILKVFWSIIQKFENFPLYGMSAYGTDGHIEIERTDTYILNLHTC